MLTRMLWVTLIVAVGLLLLIGGVHAAMNARSLVFDSPLPNPIEPQAYLPVTINMTPPLSTTSHYIEFVDHDIMREQGCHEGQRRTRGAQDVTVILDFGYPSIYYGYYGTVTLHHEIFHPIYEITWAVKGYLEGFLACSPPDSHLTLAIGTNNADAPPPYPPAVTEDHGQAWAYMVNDLNTWIIYTMGWGEYLTVYGANDIEPEFNGYWPTYDWALGYSATYNPYLGSNYINYGACTSCPYTACPYCHPPLDWTVERIYYVSWIFPPAYPLPQIYLWDDGYGNPDVNADQWQRVSHYGWQFYNNPMYFLGSLTQYGACHSPRPRRCTTDDNTPEQGWLQLWGWTYRDPHTRQSELKWSTDILWDVDWPQPPDNE